MPSKKTVPLEQIVARADLQFRKGLDPDWVDQLADNWESVNDKAPIEVVVTPSTAPGTYDTFTQHRLAAAHQLALDRVTVLVHEVSDAEAGELAAISNLTSGKPYAPDERRRAIQAIRDAHPLASVDEVARLANSSPFVTKEALAARDLERRNPIRPGDQAISDTVLRVIGRTAGLDDGIKDLLVRAARRGGWTKDQARYAVQQVKDPEFSTRYKDDLLGGRTSPIMVDKGQLAYVASVLADVPSPEALRGTAVVPKLIALLSSARLVREHLERHGLERVDSSMLSQLAAGAVDLAELAQLLQDALDRAR